MDIYNIKYKEFTKMQSEFNKTEFGSRVKIFSIMPLFVSMCFIVAAIICFTIDVNATTGVLCILGFAISLIGLSITQLMYNKLLKEFILAKKDE